MIEDKSQRELPGTFSYENWRAALGGEPELAAFEHLLFTDVRLTGTIEEGLGPYQFLNLVPPLDKPGLVQPAATLRLGIHVDFSSVPMTKTDSIRYHGGTLADEIAALASLLLGVRLRCGAQTRHFAPGGDPRGRPLLRRLRPDPVLNLNPWSQLILPAITSKRSLALVGEMDRYPRLAPKDAIALVRAARLYQDALWIAESEPHLAWLMLVSSIETVVTHWKSSQSTALEAARLWRPDLFEYIEGFQEPALAERVANELSSLTGSTKRFVDFLLTYLPDPPAKRPEEWCQIPWEPGVLRRAFSTIYSYRSTALHDGIQFPAPMCLPPFRGDSGRLDEKPTGQAMSTLGGTWLGKDMPMHLHIFEYIARQCLLTWWRRKDY